MKSVLKIFFVLCLVIGFTGCRSAREGGKTTISKADQTRYEQVINNSFDFECMQAKVKLSFKGKSLNGKLNIEHGKRLCLILNAPLFGFELGRVEANKDSITIVYKLEKMYITLPIDQLAQGHKDEITYEALESLILGRIFIPGRGTADKTDFKRLVWNTTENQELSGTWQHTDYTLTYLLNTDNHLGQTSLSFMNAAGYSATWNYGKYETCNLSGKTFSIPTHEKIIAKGNTRTIEAEMTISSPSFKASGWTSFAPTSPYKAVTWDDCKKMIKKLIK